MAHAKSSQVGAAIILAILVLFLMLAIVFLYVGWGSPDDAVGHSMSTAGYVAMTFGIVVTLALGVGLMGLVFYSNRNGHD